MKTLKRIWKKGVAFLLAATMSLSMLPVTAFAAKQEGYVTASGFSYNKDTGKVTGSVVLNGGTTGAQIRVTIISSTKPSVGNPDVNGPAGGSVNGYKPGDANASPSLPCIQFDTTIPANKTIPVDHFLASFADMQAKVTGRYANVTEFTYSVFVYDGQTNYDDDPAFTIPLSAAAELKADPNEITLSVGEGTSNRQTVDIDLTNIISGTTANNITLSNSNSTLFPNFSYITIPSSIAGGASAVLSVPVSTAAAGTGTITINYSDSSAGAQTPIEVKVTVIGSGYSVFSANEITLTGTGASGQGKTDLVYTPEGTTNANINIAMVKSITVSDGFTIDETILDQAGGAKTTFPMQTSAATLRTENKETTAMTFADYLVVTNTDPSLLVPDTIIGYVTIVYYNCNMAGCASAVKTDGSELQFQRILRVPIKYGAASEPVVTFNAGGGTLTGSATPTVTGGKVAVGDIPTASRTGYKFLGWSGGSLTNATAAQVAAVTHSADTTYTAQWEQQYRVSYDKNASKAGNGTISTVPATSGYLDKGSSYTVSTSKLTYTPGSDGKAYTFVGWNTNQNATTGLTSITVNGDTTLYAIWKQNAQVTFNPNGGNWSGSTANKVVNANASGVVAAPADPARLGHTFLGWNTAADGSGTDFNASAAQTDGTTYYAQWEIRQVSNIAVGGALQEGNTITITNITLSDNEVIQAADFGSSDLDVRGWALGGSSTTTPPAAPSATGDSFTISGSVDGQTVWVMAKGKNNNIGDTPKWVCIGKVGLENFDFVVGIHVSGSTPPGGTTGLTVTPTTATTTPGGSFNVSASSTNNGYKFKNWETGNVGSTTPVNTDGSISQFTATTTVANLTKQPGKNNIYANFVPIPHLTLKDSGGATGTQAFRGQLGNDGQASALKVSYDFPGGSKFTVKTTPGVTVAVGTGTAGNLVIECNETAPGTYTDTLTITYEDSDGVKYTLTQPVAYTVTIPTKTVHVEVAVDGGAASATLPSGVTVSPTAASPVTLKAGDSTLLSTNTTSKGYRFTGWSAVAATNGTLSNPSVTNNGGTATFTMADPLPGTDVTVVANYIKVPWLEAGNKTQGGHATGVNAVTNASVKINNTGAANATAVGVSVDDSRFELATGGMTATGNTVAAGNSGTVLVKPKNPAGLAAGTYVIPVTVTYKQVGSDTTALKVETTVTYVVTETTYTLTVKYPTGANSGVSDVKYIINGGTATAIANNGTVTVKPADVVTITATLTDCTGSWTTANCTESVDTGSVLGIHTFTGNATATLSVTGKAKLTYEPTAGAATEGAASVTTNPALKISNTGTGTANITKITVENNNSSDSKTFGGSTSTAANLAAGADRAITLAPDSWGSAWTAGTYTAKVTVEYTDSAGSHTDVTYVPFIVSAPSTFTGTVTVKWNNTDTLGSNVTGVSLTGNPTGSQAGNKWTFAGLSSASAYNITVATANGNVTSTQTLNNGNQDVTIYISTVTVATADNTNGSVTLDSGSTLTKAYEEGQAASIAAAVTTAGTTAGYKFDKWQKGSTDTGLGQSATVLAEKTNTTYTAYFTQNFKLTYNGNGTGVSNVPVDQNSYKRDEEANISATEPIRPGYDFDGWYSAATGGTKYTNKVTMTSDTTLYAHWTAVSPTGVSPITESATVHYGDNFSSNAVATAVRGANSGVSFTYSDESAAKLAAIGLTLDASGNISGRPYKVGTFTFTIRATDTRNSTYTDVNYTLTVNKAQPTLTASVASGNQTGSAFSTAKYNYTVTAPLYTGSTNGWQNATLMTGTGATLTATAADNAGTVSLDAPTTLFTNSAQDIDLTYAPGSKTDGASNAYTAIYENAATTLSVAGTGVVEALSISPNTYDFGDVYDDGSQITQTNYTQPGAHQYTIKNEGNVTTGTITVTAPTGYTITTALSKTTLAPGETATFSIQPDAHLAVGTHPGVISASYTSAQTGTPTISASAGADFEVKAPSTFSGYITVKTQAVGDTTPSVSALPGDYTVSLVPVGGGSAVTPVAQTDVATTGRYRFENADASKEYNIVVTKTGVNAGSWTVPDRLVSLANRTNQGLILYELATDDDGTSGVTTTGDGYYLAGVGVTITATASVGNMAFDKWTEVTAQSSPNPTSYSNNAASTSYAMPAQSATLTAHYKNTDATECTITYDANRPSDVKNDVNIWTPGPETGVAVGAAHTLLTGTPTLLGYTFEGWFAAPTGGTAITSVTPAGDTTVYAHWTPVALAATGIAPDGTYGTGYTGGKVSVTAPDGATATYKVTTGTLPGGLTLDEKTGAITGIPYEICTNRPVTVTVTMSNDVNTTPRTTTVDLTITIKPATPTITGVTATNVVTGQPVTTANYVVTVAGPKYEVKDGTGSWTTYVDTLEYTANSKDSGLGTAAFTGNDFGTSVHVKYTPAGETFDGANQDQDAVWTEKEGDFTVSANANKVTLTVDPTEWEYKKADGSHAQESFTATTGTDGMVTAANAVAPKQFTLKNEGNVPSGTLSYKFASANAAGQAGDYFSFAWGTATAAGLGANASGTFTVSVRDTEITQAGTYTDTLTISNAAGDSATVYRLVFVVDKSATYTATVTVKVKNVGGSLTAGKMPTTGFTAITLVPSDTSTGATTVTLSDTYWDNTNTNYKVTGLVTGVTYTVKTGDFVLGAVAVNGDNVDVELYQVQLDKTPSTITVTQTGAGYYAKGQGASIATPASATGGYAFQEWADDATTPNKIATASFNAVIQDAVKYTATYTAALTLTYDLNGGTAGTTPNPDTESHQAKDLVTLASCDATKTGYSFGGWNTKQDGSGVTYQPGATFSMPAENTTLYAVWIENDTPVVAPSGSWTVAHRDTLSQTLTAGGGVGGYTYTVTGSGLPGTTNVTVTGGSTLTIASGTNGAEYTKDGTNTGSVSVGVTDKSGAAANPAGTVTVIVVQAATSVTTGVDAGYKPYEGDDFDFTELENPEVIVKKTDGTPNTSVDINEMPTAADGTAPEGTWKVVGTNPTTKDGNPAIEYVLEFTPSDPGFLPSQTTVTVPIQTRKIKAAEIGIFFPKTGDTPKTSISGDNGKKIAATTDPSVTTPVDTFTVKSVSWSETSAFDTQKPNTVWVELEAADGWKFDDSFVGTLTDQNSPSSGSKTAPDVQVVGNSGDKLTLVYTFDAEDVALNLIDVTTTIPVVNGFSTTVAVPSDHVLEYKITSSEWRATTGDVKVEDVEGKRFAKDANYDLIVTVEANKGYVFDATTFSGAKPTDLTGKATVNGGNPPEGSKASRVETALSADGKTLTIRYTSFIPNEKEVVGIEWVSGNLTTTDYYVMTATDKNGGSTDVGAAANNIYGHDSHSAIYSAANDIKFREVYKDGEKGPEMTFGAANTLYYGSTANSANWTAMPDDGHVFVSATVGSNTPAVAGTSDQTTFDGKNVYFSYTKDGKTYYAPTSVGTLTVQELKADKLTPSRQWTTAELTFVKDTAFKLPTTSVPTATVNFNTGVALDNTEAGWAYAENPNNGSNTHFYSTDVASAAAAKTAELKAGATMADSDNGKTVYMCYIDINGNLVYAPVGVLKVSGDTNLTVTAVNISDPTDNTDNGGSAEPEYGETLRADVTGKDGYTPTGTLTYEWQYKDTDGSWKPIPGATDPTYTLGKDDVGREIRVEVKEQGTSGSATSNDPLGNPRTLKLDVVRVSKPYDGTTTNTHTYVTTSATVNDFTLSNVMSGDTVYVSAYTGTKPVYGDSIVGSTFDWPAITAAGWSNDYTLTGPVNAAGTAVYRLGDQAALSKKGEIVGGNNIVHVDVYLNGPVNGGTPAPNPVGVDSLTETTASNGGTNLTDFGLTWYKVADGATFDVTNLGTPHTAAFGAAETYAVVVPVRPAAGKEFNADTEFYFHIDSEQRKQLTLGHTTESGVYKDGNDYKMFYTFAPTKDSDVPTLTGISATPLSKTLYYMTTSGSKTPGHEENTRANAPGDVNAVPFAFDTTGVTVTATTLTGSNSSTSTVTPTRFYVVDKNNSNAKVTLTAGATFANDDYDGCEVYVEYTAGGVTKDAYVGTLAIRELTAERITPTLNNVKLSYSVGDMNLDLSGVTGAKVDFNMDTAALKNDYSTTGSAAAAGDVTKHYFELSADGQSFDAVKHGDTLTGNDSGKTLYICYKDVNEHVVRAAIGTLAVNSVDASTAAIRLENQDHANEHTQYGDTLKVIPSGNSNGEMKYTWQVSADGTNNWTDLDAASMTDVTINTWDALKYVGQYVRVVLTKDGDKTVPAGKIVSNVLKINPKEITIRYSWTTGSKVYDGTTTVPNFSTTVVYDVDHFKGQLVGDDADHITPDHTAAAFESATVGTGKRIELTFGSTEKIKTDDAADHPISNYTVTSVVEPTGAITDDGVTMVTVTYKEPVTGETGDTNPTYADNTKVEVTGSTWYTKTTNAAPAAAADFTGAPLGSNTYLDSTFYLVTATVSPKAGTGTKFDSTTMVTVNGVIVGVDETMGTKKDASGKDIGWAVAKLESNGTITIKYIAQTETVDKEIIEITANLTAPSASKDPASTVTTASATNKEPKDVKSVGLAVTNPTVTWTGAMEGGKFAMDTVYTAEFTYEAKTADNYNFRVGDTTVTPNVDPIKFTINGITVMDVTGENEKTENNTTVKVEKVGGSTDKYKLTVTFPETSGLTSIMEVAVNYTVPAVGDHPAKSANYMPTDKVKLGANEGTDALKYNDLVTDRSTGSTWFQGSSLPASGNGLAADAVFGNGDYTVLAHFEAVDGNKFISGTNGTKFTVNGTEYPANSSHVTIVADGLSATVWHTFPGLDKEIMKVITAVTAPVAGAAPQTTADTTLAANKASTNLLPDALTNAGKAAITWKTAAGGNVGATFDYSTAYTAEFDVTVASGYSYLKDTTTPDYVDFLVNSTEDADAVNVNDTTANTHIHTYADGTTVTLTKTSDTVYHVKVEFPATDAKVDKILTVNVNTTVPPEHKLRVPEVYIVSTEPYTNPADPAKTDLVWKVKGGDGSWTVVAQNTPFEAGKEYMVEGKVVLKDPTTTTWNITDDTKFFLGGVAVPKTAATGSLNDTTGGSVSYTTGFTASETAVGGIYPKDTVFTLSLTFGALADKTDPTIVKVAANVRQPIANQTIPSGNAALLLALNKDGVDMSAYVTPSAVTWTEKNADGNFVTPTGTTFRMGGSYKAEFTLTANNANHKYIAVADPKDYLDLLINGVTHTGGAWLEGSTDTETVGADGSINQIKVEIEPNTAGSEATCYKVIVTFNNISDKADVLAVLGTAKVPTAHATISTNDIDALPGQVYEKQSARWLDKDGNPVTETEFKPGNTYIAELTVKIKDAEKPYYRFKDTTTGLLNGSNATVVTRDPATGEPTTITLKLSFNVPKEVVKVHVASNRPAVGDQTVVNDTNKSIGKANAAEDRYDLNVVDTLDGTDLYGKWYTDANCTIPATQFEEEKTYYMQVEVTPGEDYTLTEEPGDYTWDTNRQNANSVKKVGDKYVAVFEYTIRKAGEKTPNELAVVVTPPVAGKNVDKVGKPGNDDTTVKGDVKWTDGSGNEVNKFDYNTAYTATVVVEPKDPNNFDFTDPAFKLNGVTPTAKENLGEDGQPDGTYTLTYTFPPTAPKETVTVPGGGGGGGGTTELPVVTYWLGEIGVTNDLTAEKVRMNGKPSKVPKVEGLTIEDGADKKTYTFIGWSETDPAKTTGTPVLVDPTTFKISKDKTFYAVYEISGHTAIDHTHYVIGFPDGTFGPSADITRGEVATIIARACLDGFIEGANYGNPGGYSDVERHWAYSAISYCTMNSVFTGYTDGTFRPNQPITRQELATVVARLHGLIANQGVPFTDADQISKWAVDGVYTAYAKGWINGYKDGSFKPLQNITRAETVKVFNGYLGRGVDVKGLEEMKEYVHSGVASNNRENGYDEYMTWPDVPKTHWAYYEIIEAANDHTFYWLDETNPVPPEHWTSVWIDEVWRYHDNSSDGARPVNPETSTPGY